MKKIFTFLSVLFVAFSLNAQSLFEGYWIEKDYYKWEDNTDVVIEKYKANIDANKDLQPSQKAMAKSMAGAIVKNALKRYDMLKYVELYPNGDFTTIVFFQGDNNRKMAAIPELGRVLVQDGNTGELIIAFPKLKIAYRDNKINWQNNGIKEICTKSDIKFNEDEIVMMDGYRCVANFAGVEADKYEGDISKAKTMVKDGKTYVLVPAPGFILADYNKIYKQVEISNEFVTQEIKMTKFQHKKISDANFTPDLSGYKIFKDSSKMFKAVKKAADNGTLAFPMDENNIPDNIWDLFK